MKSEGKCKYKHKYSKHQDGDGREFESCDICGVCAVSFKRKEKLE